MFEVGWGFGRSQPFDFQTFEKLTSKKKIRIFFIMKFPLDSTYEDIPYRLFLRA